jgi:alcohol dehydrogenase (cytochrome c)
MTQFTRFPRMSRRAKMLAGAWMLAGAVIAPAFAADEVSHDRLLNADKEPGNWLHHHKNFFGAPVLQPDRDQQG